MGINYPLRKKILDSKRLEKQLRLKYFQNKSFEEIRDWFERNSINRHYPIEYYSAEIAIVTPKGIMMQISPDGEDQIKLWGGPLNDTESFSKRAVMLFLHEIGINVDFEELKFVEFSNHFQRNENGDQFYFYSYRFILLLYDVPKIKLFPEEVFFMTKHNRFDAISRVISHQEEFIHYLLDKYYS